MMYSRVYQYFFDSPKWGMNLPFRCVSAFDFTCRLESGIRLRRGLRIRLGFLPVRVKIT